MFYPNFAAQVAMKDIAWTYPYNGESVLSLSISYPQVTLPKNPKAQRVINARINYQVNAFRRTVCQDLYRQAVSQYRDAQQSGFPFRSFEAVLNYTVAYNERCHLSIFYDTYEYTGGAHGNTLRSSDTFNLQTGTLLPLASFFEPYQHYKPALLDQVMQQADWNMQQNPGVYFDNYRLLIKQNFDEDNYYLTPDGLALYFQQYEIAPYASGIVTFVIPYDNLGWQPSCL